MVTKQKHTIILNKREINYLLSKSKSRRSIAIYVDDKANVSVYCPYFVKQNVVEGFLKEKADWIFKKVLEAEKNRNYLDSKEFADGQTFLFLGRKYKINIIKKDIKRIRIDFDGMMWIVCVPIDEDKCSQELLKKAFVKWYKSQAKEVLGGRIFHYSRILGVGPSKITIRTLKRIWGNCAYHTQAITLNWQIVLSPISVVDYIVVHELCHLIVPNHSKRFWNKVEKILPHYKREVKWLKDNHLEMQLP